MLFTEIRRVYSHGYMNYIPKFRETFPELKELSNEELCERWKEMDVEFYSIKQKPVRFWVRLTLPLALILMLLMYIYLPINFIIKGKWGYEIHKNKFQIYNWLKMLHLL